MKELEFKERDISAVDDERRDALIEEMQNFVNELEAKTAWVALPHRAG